MNKEELLKEYDEKAKALRDEFISKLEDDKKEFKLTYPEDEEVLYCISNANASIYAVWFSTTDNCDTKAFKHGLYFKTREEAEQHLRERKLLFKLQQWAKEKNEGWEPDWEDTGMDKWNIYFNHGYKGLAEMSIRIQEDFFKLPYFKSEEIAQECIELFGDEIKEVLV